MDATAFTVVRATHFLAVLVPPGVLAFERLVSGPALSPDHPGHKSMHRLAFASAVLALAGGLVWFAMVASDMSGEPLNPDVVSLVLGQTWFGKAWVVHIALIVVLVGILAFRHSACPSMAVWLVSLAALVSLSFAGHAGATPHPAASVPVDALHLIAASFWPAGLLPMAFYLWKLRGAPKNHPALAFITERFSRLSIPAVAILALSGIANAWLIVGRMPSLQGDYFRLLLAKTTALGIMTAIGAVNLLELKPCLLKKRASSLLLVNVSVETLLFCVILVLTATLGQLPPQ